MNKTKQTEAGIGVSQDVLDVSARRDGERIETATPADAPQAASR